MRNIHQATVSIFTNALSIKIDRSTHWFSHRFSISVLACRRFLKEKLDREFFFYFPFSVFFFKTKRPQKHRFWHNRFVALFGQLSPILSDKKTNPNQTKAQQCFLLKPTISQFKYIIIIKYFCYYNLKIMHELKICRMKNEMSITFFI